MRRIDIPNGSRFGRLRVLEEMPSRILRGRSYRLFRCECDCGEVRDVLFCNLRTGGSTSCGCLTRERTAESHRTHGMSYMPTYNIWVAMLARCHDPNNDNFHRYGGRGISVCGRWRESCQAFIEDVGPRPSTLHTLDRIDNDGNYEPSNVRWVTQREQCRNTRRNVFLTFQGQTKCVAEWAEITGVPSMTILGRFRRNLPIEAVLANRYRIVRSGSDDGGRKVGDLYPFTVQRGGHGGEYLVREAVSQGAPY